MEDQDKIIRKELESLRRRAEELLKSRSAVKGAPGIEKTNLGKYLKNPLKLIHELQTFQIELELQNKELLRSQQELIASRASYTELYDFAPVGYLTISSRGIVRKANFTFADMISIPKTHIVDHPFSDHVASEDQDIYYHHLRTLFESKDRQVCELRLKQRSGEILYVQIESNVTSGDPGETGESRTMVSDITRRKQAEDERQDLEQQLHRAQNIESIGILAGGIAHDFNNILFPIMGFTEMTIQDLPDDHALQKNLEAILHGAIRASNLVKKILLFGSQRHDEKKPVTLQPLIVEVLSLLRSTIPADIKIEHDLDERVCLVFGDGTELYGVIMNLCTNAFHAMEQRGGTLTVTLNRVDSGTVREMKLSSANYCCLQVHDTGEGISPRIIEKIFDPYFTTKKFGKGSGLGLSVVHGIVKNYGGTITVNSEMGTGTVFSLYLPLTSETQPQEIADPPLRPVDNERILFVDDESQIVSVGAKILERCGYNVTGKTSSMEALSTFQENPWQFDLVITDMTMPGIVGTELAKRMMDLRPGIPIIICTGFSERIDPETAAAIGICAYINKPVLSAHLATIVRRVLDARIPPSLIPALANLSLSKAPRASFGEGRGSWDRGHI
ncbi:MAG: ATP-binding protein [Desulfobacterium sp.]|jgi:PAS domain S-box-containing protein|nr:ATP-binding protein [Desulfobacterium sp.]